MANWHEKWNYRPIFVGEVSKGTRREFSVAQVAELYDITYLSWNDFESEVIAKILEISTSVLEINGIRPIKVHNEQIIILEKDVFLDKVANSENETGKCSNGFVYVCRNENKSVFVSDLSHELSHLYSYYSLQIKEDGEFRYIDTAQLGYSLLLGKNKHDYDGLNEAVTEMWSKVILSQLFREYPALLTESEQEEALSYYAYPYHAALIEEIIFKMTKDNVLALPLFKSYFDGSTDFLDLLNEELPLMGEHLRLMTNTKASALKTLIGAKIAFNEL